MKFVIPDPENPIVGKFSTRLKGGGIVNKCKIFKYKFDILMKCYFVY